MVPSLRVQLAGADELSIYCSTHFYEPVVKAALGGMYNTVRCVREILDPPAQQGGFY
jgi:hypothetical protein